MQKVALQTLPSGRQFFRYTTTDGLLGYAGTGQGKVPAEERAVKVTVLAAHGNIASVEIDSVAFVDYAHVARIDGRWQVVNVLWRPKQGR